MIRDGELDTLRSTATVVEGTAFTVERLLDRVDDDADCTLERSAEMLREIANDLKCFVIEAEDETEKPEDDE